MSADVRPLNEIEALAHLLAEVVMLAGQGAMFPSHLEEIAERAQEQTSVQAALHALCDEHRAAP